MNERFQKYIKEYPLSECLIITTELVDERNLVLVLDNVTKHWEAYYQNVENGGSDISTRWFQQLTFPNIEKLIISDHAGQQTFKELAHDIAVMSLCVSSFNNSDDLYEIELSPYTLSFRCSEPVLVEERMLGVKQSQDSWIYFDLETLAEVPFKKPFTDIVKPD